MEGKKIVKIVIGAIIGLILIVAIALITLQQHIYRGLKARVIPVEQQP